MKNRIIQVPVSYRGYYYLPRRRTPDQHKFRADVPVSLVEMDETEAPVAIEIDCVPGARGTVSFRWDGQSFWRPMLAENEESPVGIDDLISRVAAEPDPLYRLVENGVIPSKVPASPPWRDWPFPRYISGSNRPDSFEDPFRLVSRDHIQWRWHEDDLEKVEKQAHEAAEGVAVIGGIMYLRTQEPYLCYGTHNGIVVCPSLPYRGALGRFGPGLNSISTRLDRLSDLMALKDSLTPDAAPSAASHDSVRVIMPEALQRDDLDVAAKMLFGPLLDFIGNSVSALSSTQTVRLWCDLRDAADAYASGEFSAFETGLDILQKMPSAGMDIDRTRHPMVSDIHDTVKFHIETHDRIFRPLLSSGLDTLSALHL